MSITYHSFGDIRQEKRTTIIRVKKFTWFAVKKEVGYRSQKTSDVSTTHSLSLDLNQLQKDIRDN